MSNLLKRLEIIRIAIDLGDEDVVALQASRLPSEAAKLAQLLEQQEYANATAWMAEYRQNNTMLTEFIDPEVSALRLELASFENTLTALTTSKAEYEQRIAEFNAAYMHAVGPTLEKVLQQRIQQAERLAAEQADANEEDLRQARDEYEEFHRQQQAQPPVQHLSDDDKAELKRLYKQGAFKCHPDRLADDLQAQATEKFKQLQAAYNQQDLARVRQILTELNDGDWVLGSATISDKAMLNRRISDMRATITTLEAEIAALLADETWCLIESLATDSNSWDDYFSSLRSEMEKQLVDE